MGNPVRDAARQIERSSGTCHPLSIVASEQRNSHAHPPTRYYSKPMKKILALWTALNPLYRAAFWGALVGFALSGLLVLVF